MQLIYLAAPLSPVGDETRQLNIHRAKVIYEVLSTQHTDCAFIAPWVMKRHALVKHPVNLLRVMAAGLRGEEI